MHVKMISPALSVFLAAVATVAFAGLASAASISNATTSADIGVSSVPTPSLGWQGYVFYDTYPSSQDIYTGTDTSPVSYVTLTPNSLSKYSDATYTALNINGDNVNTGVLYNSGATGTIDTIALTQTGINGSSTLGALVAPFTVGVLEDNATNTTNNDMISIALSLSAGTSGTTDSANGSQNVAGNSPVSNDFYQFTITGAHVGDQIAVEPTGTGVNFEIGGLTFDTAVPEPTTFALISLAAPVLLRRRRRPAILV